MLLIFSMLTLMISSQLFAQNDKDIYQQGNTMDKDAIRTKIMSAYDAFNNDQYDKLGDYIDAGFIDHSPFPNQKPGLSGLIESFKMMRTAYPDYKMTVKDVIIDGNKAAVLFNFKGTNTGEMMGMKATNKVVDVEGLDLLYLSNGKATEHWGYIDTDKMMNQLGMGMDNMNKDHMKMKKDKNSDYNK